MFPKVSFQSYPTFIIISRPIIKEVCNLILLEEVVDQLIETSDPD